MTQQKRRRPARWIAPVVGGLLTAASLFGCATGGPSAVTRPTEERQLMAEYRQIQGTSLEREEARLRILKQLGNRGTSGSEQFVFQALGSFDAPVADVAEPAPVPPKLAVWSEFLPYERVVDHLPALKARGLSLLVAVTPEKAEDPALFALFREGAALGVDVRPWLLVPAEHGYWANKWNYREVTRFVLEFVDRMTAQGHSPKMITLDIEPPVSLTQPLAARLEKVDLVGARRLLVASSKDGSLSEARSAYQQLVETLHGRGVRVHAVTTPMVLDDLAVGRGRLQSALGIPVDGVSWDEVTCMTYRTEFLRLAGKMDGDIVQRYARDAKRFFGARAGLDLGVIGSPGFGSPALGYTDPADLMTDLNAASMAGVSRINVFSLDGMLEQGGIDRWVQSPEPKPVRPEAKALFIRALIQTLARTLPAAE